MKHPATKKAAAPSLLARLLLGKGRAAALLDLVDENRTSSGARRRRPFPVERRRFDEAVTARRRLLTVATARHERLNNPDAIGYDRALRVHVVGDRGKPFFRDGAASPWFAEAERFFADWGRHADFVTGAPWRECLKRVVSALAFEGDLVAVFDDGRLSGGEGSGRFAFFAADRICPLAAGDFAAWKKETSRPDWTQAGGVLFDGIGRFAGVVVSRHRGASETALADAFVLVHDPLDPDAAGWRHVSRPSQFDAIRAVPDSAASLPQLVDASEIRAASNLATKQSVARHGILRHDFSADPDPRDLGPAWEDEADPATDTDNLSGSGDASGDATTASGSTSSASATAEAEAAALPDFRGLSDVVRGASPGAVDVIDKNDEFTVTPQTSPNLNVPAYLEEENRFAARAHGLPSLLATLHADHSYSGARAELALAEENFKDLRQFLEDAFSDWAALQVFRWAMRTGRLSAAAPDGWERSLAWQYPRIPFLDPKKEVEALVARYKAGESLEDLGYRPEEIMASHARDKALAERYGVTDVLSYFAPAPGAAPAAADPATPEDGVGDGDGEDEEDLSQEELERVYREQQGEGEGE